MSYEEEACAGIVAGRVRAEADKLLGVRYGEVAEDESIARRLKMAVLAPMPSARVGWRRR